MDDVEPMDTRGDYEENWLELMYNYQQGIKEARVRFETAYKNNNCPKVRANEFTRVGYLGRGGYGAIYQARHTASRADFAIKEQPKNAIVRVAFRDFEFLNEKRFSYAMDSLFVTKGHATFRDPGNLYLILDLAPYGTLMNVMPFADEDVARAYLGQVVMGLEYMHAANIIHADLKPENILLFFRGRVKLADFGCSSTAYPGVVLRIRGTLTYMAPEILRWEPQTDAIDWWSFGVMMFWGLADYHPYWRPEEIDQAIDAANRDPDFQTLVVETITMPMQDVEDNIRLSDAAKDLVTLLLQIDVTKRIGSTRNGILGVKSHPWFNGFDFARYMTPRSLGVPRFYLEEVRAKRVEGVKDYAELQPDYIGGFDEF